MVHVTGHGKSARLRKELHACARLVAPATLVHPLGHWPLDHVESSTQALDRVTRSTRTRKRIWPLHWQRRMASG